MHPYSVSILEGLSLCVNGGEGNHSGIESVYSAMGRSSSVGALPNELDLLGHSPVTCPSETEFPPFLHSGGVGHHCHVNVIELPQLYQFGLSAQKGDFTCLAQALSKLNFNVLLSGHGYKGNPSLKGW